MDLGGQDHKRIVMPSSFVYNSSITELNPKRPSHHHASLFSTPVSYGAGVVSSSSQVFHHNDHLIYRRPSPPPPVQPLQPLPPSVPQQQQPESPPSQGRASDPQPEPVSVIAVPAGVTPIVGGLKHGNPTSRSRILLEATSVLYRECLKNHAANTGGHVVDGCGEFMPGGEEGTPEALKCTACECHRNFHRREGDGEVLHSGANYYRCYNPNSTIPLLPPPLPQQHQKFPIGLSTAPPPPPGLMNLGRGGATDSSSQELNVDHHTNLTTGPGQPPHYGCSFSKKRFRTKFTNEQKEKMLEFAEKVGWRMPKQDEAALLEHFCEEVGVKRQVLKVWMHNNKHTMRKKDL